VISVDFVEGLGSGLLVAGLVYLLLWYGARRARSIELPLDAASQRPEPSPEDRPGPGSMVETGPSTSPEGPAHPPPLAPPPPAPEPEPRGEPLTDSARRIERTNPVGGPAAPEGNIRLSQRVILHLYAQGDLPAGAVAPPGFCQAGIGEALGISQGGLAAVLRRLEAAGIFTTERGHVQGRDRRLKIYRLSARGLEVARELRARAQRAQTVSRAGVPARADTGPGRQR
jgi:DNA-binding MarR family transcriptional regulator